LTSRRRGLTFHREAHCDGERVHEAGQRVLLLQQLLLLLLLLLRRDTDTISCRRARCRCRGVKRRLVERACECERRWGAQQRTRLVPMPPTVALALPMPGSAGSGGLAVAAQAVRV